MLGPLTARQFRRDADAVAQVTLIDGHKPKGAIGDGLEKLTADAAQR
jgi:hypothetical protein